MPPPAEVRRRGWLIVEHEPGTYKATLFGLESNEAVIVAGIGAILRTGISPHASPALDESELSAASKVLAESLSSGAAAQAVAAAIAAGGEVEVEAKRYQRLLKDLTVDDLIASRELADLVEPHSIEHGWFGNIIDPYDEAYVEAMALCKELVAILLLLNSRNATQTGVAPDLAALNRARVKKGNPPYYH